MLHVISGNRYRAARPPSGGLFVPHHEDKLMAFELETIIEKLKEKRPVFHPEADFQHSLAWEIQKTYPSASVRLEKPFPLEADNVHNSYLDIFITHENKKYAIELKYKTCGLDVGVAGEDFHLRNHGAHRDNRIHFASDIYRLKRMKESKQANYAYALMLTNECLYWLTPILANSQSDFHWLEYSKLDDSKRGQFRYLLLEI